MPLQTNFPGSSFAATRTRTLLLLTLLFALIDIYSAGDTGACPNACNSQGRCVIPGRICQCFDGFTGPDCSLYVCPFHNAWVDQAIAPDVAHQPAECSNMGSCDRTTGLCVCRSGWEGKACERKSCQLGCNGVGRCVSMSYYAKTRDPGAIVPFSGSVPLYENNWDAYMMYGCSCDNKYGGFMCSLRLCPTGDDPMTGNGANTLTNPTQVNEIQRGQCKAGQGTFTLTFRGKTTTPIPFNAKAAVIQAALEALPTIGTGGTKVVMASPQACIDSGGSWTVEFLQNFGNLPQMVPDARLLSFQSGVQVPYLVISKTQRGTKENAPCSNRGLCDATTGYCTCSTNYDTSNGYGNPGIRGDCGDPLQTIQACPGTVSCSGHGECLGNPTYSCSCSDGWTGADCSNRQCPTDVAWFTAPQAVDVAHISEQVECSNAGTCDRTTGICACDIGFTGATCGRFACPGTTSPCSGHGSCQDMFTLAKLATVNGVIPTAPGSLITYGNVPNNPKTWDALKVFGCLCDTGYTGYDCALRTCPFGDDPATTGQADEQQIITCQVPTDNFAGAQISFVYKQQQGPTISLVAGGATPTTAADLKANLQSIPGIRVVTIDPLDSTKDTLARMCTTTGNNLVITFRTEHGDLPLLQPIFLPINTQNMAVTVSPYVAGSKESIECSGRGLCNRASGTCACFNGYGSSDGQGNQGLYADCGYIQPMSN